MASTKSTNPSSLLQAPTPAPQSVQPAAEAAQLGGDFPTICVSFPSPFGDIDFDFDIDTNNWKLEGDDNWTLSCAVGSWVLSIVSASYSEAAISGTFPNLTFPDILGFGQITTTEGPC